MTCDEFLGTIDAYLDDALSIRDILRVHRHLLSCECCHQVMGSEATLHSLLADDAARDQPPGSLRERIILRVAAEESARSRARLGQASSSSSTDLRKQECGGPDTSRS